MAEGLNYQINIQGNASQSIGEIKKQLKEANSELIQAQANFGEYSNEAIAAAKKVAALRDSIQEARETADLFDPGKKFQAFTGALTSIAAGYSAVQGAIGLLGVENKELEKQLLRVQSALALSQGLSALADSAKDFQRLSAIIQSTTLVTRANAAANTLTAATMRALGIAVDVTSTSFRVLKGVIAATGIGLAVIAIGELISALSSWSSEADKAAESQKKLNEETKKSADIALEAELASLSRTEEVLKAEAKLRGATEEEIFKIEQDSRKLRIKARERYVAEVGKIDFEAGMKAENQLKNEQNTLRASELNFLAEEKKRKEEAEKEREQKAKERLEKEKQELEKLTEARRKAADAGLKFDLLVLESREKAQKEKEDADKKREEEGQAQIEKDFENETLRLEKLQESTNKRLSLEKQAADEELKVRQQVEDAKFAAASAGLNLLGSLVGQNEKLANAIFVVDKALAVAKIIVDTQREIAGYAANPTWTLLPDGGLAIKTKAATAAKIRAAASIATIGATTIAKFKGGSVASNFGGGGAINTIGTPIVPTQQAQLTQLNQATINAIGNQAIRAYVVETDITTNQQRVQAIRQRARFS